MATYGAGTYGTGTYQDAAAPTPSPVTVGPVYVPSPPVLQSLLIGPYEVAPGHPGPFCLLPGLTLGDPQAVTSLIEDTLLDGEQVEGDSSGNRTVSLDVIVTAVDPRSLGLAVDMLESVVNSRSWVLTYTPPGGLPVLFDAMRGQVTTDYQLEMLPVGLPLNATQVRLEFPCQPFGRSPSREMLTLQSSVLIDGFETAPSSGSSPAWTTTTDHTQGTYGVISTTTAGSSGVRGGVYLSASRTFTALDISTMNTVTLSIKTVSGGTVTTYPPTLQLVTTSGVSGTLIADRAPSVNTGFQTVTWQIPTASSTFDPTRVTGYQLSGSTSVILTSGQSLSFTIDDMEARPPYAIASSNTVGSVFGVLGVKGTARAPVAVEVQRDAGISSLVLHSASPLALPRYAPLVTLDPGTGSQTVSPPDDGMGGGLRYKGTHALYLVASSLDAVTTSRTVTVTARQVLGDGSGGVQTFDVVRSFVPSTLTNGLLYVGTVTLPLRDWPADATANSHQWTITSQDSADRWSALLALDLTGSTVIVGQTPGATPPGYVWVDEPDPVTGHQPVLSGTSRSSAWGAYDATDQSGLFSVNPGGSRLLVVCPQGSPGGVRFSYAPRWRRLRTDLMPVIRSGYGVVPYGTTGYGL